MKKDTSYPHVIAVQHVKKDIYSTIHSESVNRKNKAGYVIIIMVENKALFGGSTFFGMVNKEEHHLNRVLNEVRQTMQVSGEKQFQRDKKRQRPRSWSVFDLSSTQQLSSQQDRIAPLQLQEFQLIVLQRSCTTALSPLLWTLYHDTISFFQIPITQAFLSSSFTFSLSLDSHQRLKVFSFFKLTHIES